MKDTQALSIRPMEFADLLQDRTSELHRKAERTGAIAHILRGKAGIETYGLYLRNLLPAYEQLEVSLTQRANEIPFKGIAVPALRRSMSIAADLREMYGVSWRDRLPVLPASATYASRIADAAVGDGSRLLAHAYVRYLGDLNGGQILKRVLAKSLGLSSAALTFYDFDDIVELESFRTSYRSAIGGAALAFDEQDRILEEACTAFRHNIELSVEVQEFAEATA